MTGEAGGVRAWVARWVGVDVCVIGDVMADEYVWGEVHRISPEAPVPVVAVNGRTLRPGGAANVAMGVAALGGRASLGGVVGDDGLGGQLREALGAGGVGLVATGGLVTDGSRPTTTKTRIIAGAQQVVRADVESTRPLDDAIRAALLDATAEARRCARMVVLSDYGKGVVNPALAENVLAEARAAGIPVVVDPKGSDYTRFRGATLLTPNQAEAERASGVDVDDDVDLARAGWALADLIGGAVLVTRGSRGMVLFDPARPGGPVVVPARAREVFDVTGAGDTVVATMALALGAGIGLDQAAHLATMAAGVVIAKVGTSVVTPDDLAEFERRADPADPADPAGPASPAGPGG